MSTTNLQLQLTNGCCGINVDELVVLTGKRKIDTMKIHVRPSFINDMSNIFTESANIQIFRRLVPLSENRMATDNKFNISLFLTFSSFFKTRQSTKQ